MIFHTITGLGDLTSFLTATGDVAETSASALTDILTATPASAEIQQDLQQLKPNVILETIKGWTPGLFALGYRLLAAGIIMFIGTRAAQFVRSFLKRTFQRMDLDLSVSKFLLSVVNAGIYAIFAFVALDKLGVPSASIVALLGSAGLAIGLSLQGSLGNVAGGILIMMTRPFKLHDYIVFGGMEGTVQSIGLAYTTLTTVDNKKITIPNGSISNGTIVNVTAQEKRRVDVSVGISYESDLKLAKNVLREIYENNEWILKDEDITVFVSELADSAVMIGARGWVKTADYWSAYFDITEKIKLEFDRAGIEIPYNKMDVTIKKGN